MGDVLADLPAGSAPSTIATVARVSPGQAANWMTAGISYGGQAVRGVRIVGNASTGFAAMPTINDDLISTLSLVGQHRSMIGIFRAASGTLHIDGGAFAKNYAAALATVTPSRIVVMARTGAGGPGFEAWRGNVAETMLFAGELSADQISALRVSHQNAWGRREISDLYGYCRRASPLGGRLCTAAVGRGGDRLSLELADTSGRWTRRSHHPVNGE